MPDPDEMRRYYRDKANRTVAEVPKTPSRIKREVVSPRNLGGHYNYHGPSKLGKHFLSPTSATCMYIVFKGVYYFPYDMLCVWCLVGGWWLEQKARERLASGSGLKRPDTSSESTQCNLWCVTYTCTVYVKPTSPHIKPKST